MSTSREERAAELISRFRYAESWRQQYDERAVEYYKLYVGHRDPLPKEKQGRSNLHIPRTYEEIDTIRARLVKAFFGTARPYIDFVPAASYGATLDSVRLDAAKAQLAGALVDQQLERNQIVRVFYDFVTSFLVFPAAIMGVGWRYERRKVRRRVPMVVQTGLLLPDGTPELTVLVTEQEMEATVWDDNEIINIDFFDFWPDPRGRDIDSCRFVFHREWCTREQLEAQLEVLDEAGAGTVYPLDWDALASAGAGLEEGVWERMSAVGLTPETRDGYDSQDGRLYEVLHYWEDDKHAILVNRSELAYDGASPYWRHGKKPFVLATFDPLPGQLYGLSAAHLIEHLQHELNTTRNQRIDNVSLVLNRMLKVRRGADIDESELVWRPYGVIYVDSPDDVTDFQMQDVTASSYNEEQIIKQDMENVLGVPAVVRGVTPSRRETATEVVTKNSNASIRFDVKIVLFETLGIKRLAYLMDCNNQQFVDAPRLLRLADQGDAAAWRLVRPEDIIGEFDYRPAGASVDPAANKEVRRQQLNELMQVVLASNNPFVDKYELTKMWLEAYDIRNVQSLLIPKEKLMNQMMAVQALQAQAQPAAPAALPPVQGGTTSGAQG